MAKLKLQKLKASTLLEVIVAMVIILIVFVMAAQIYANVVQSSPSAEQQYLRATAENYFQNSLEEKEQDSAVLPDSTKIEKKTEAYAGYTDVFLCTVTFSRNGKNIGTYHRIIQKDKEEAHE
ncbi:type II secretion system protein [Pedobacter nutrimenti]|uniref:PulJ/GspJ family protein n=1 Tax=Pedobacter nutrimenti TaxID=1241337 RepID=UPI00292DF60F|nr:type II secretion system protein [Pedobacter nutrimenti]